MRQSTFPFSTTILAIVALLLFSTCKKKDNLPCLPATCSAESMLTTLLGSTWEDTLRGPYYAFRKTFDQNGRVNSINGSRVVESGDHVYIIKSNGDTLTATLNSDRQVRQLAASYYNSHGELHKRFTDYTYNENGKLAQIVNHDTESSSIVAYNYSYDQYGNMAIASEDASTTSPVGGSFYYQYDYSKPIKGGFYYQGVGFGMTENLMDALGYLDTQPHHQLKAINSTNDAWQGTWIYKDQVVDANGYLLSYKTTRFIIGYLEDSVKVNITWHCGSKHSTHW